MASLITRLARFKRMWLSRRKCMVFREFSVWVVDFNPVIKHLHLSAPALISHNIKGLLFPWQVKSWLNIRKISYSNYATLVGTTLQPVVFDPAHNLYRSDFVKWIEPALNLEESTVSFNGYQDGILRISSQRYRTWSKCTGWPSIHSIAGMGL